MAIDTDLILFVSDLDGTLLRPDATLGERTVQVVNDLVARGGLFTYATARSFTSASRVTAGLDLQLPVITYAGAVIVDPRSGALREVASLPPEAVLAVQQATSASASVQPILFAMHGGRDRVCWLRKHTNRFVEGFLSHRRDDPRLFPLDSWAELDEGSVFYVSIIGEQGPLQDLQESLNAQLGRCHVVFAEDIYSPGEYWLEITSATGTKAAALQTIRRELEVHQLVCFGDNHNDLPMFATADVSLAVANAVPEVRHTATEIIGTNATEGVAEWLARHASQRRTAPGEPEGDDPPLGRLQSSLRQRHA